MPNKTSIFALCLVTGLLLCTSAFASNRPDLSGWAVPDQASLEAANRGGTILETKTELRWTPDQLREFPVRGGESVGSFFPSLVYQADETNELQPQVMMTNLPGAKFFRTAADEQRGEQIKLSVLGAASLQSNKPYTFYTGWRYTGEEKGNPLIKLRSLQEFDQGVRGTINELKETGHELAAIRWNEAKPVDLPQSLRAAFNKDPFVFPWEDEEEAALAKRLKGYTDIDSKQDLDQYKSSAAKLLTSAPDCCEPIRFAITFKSSIGVKGVNQLAEEYHLNVEQYYAVGKRGKQEEYTVSWFDPQWERPLSLVRIFDSLLVTELEGTASGEDLKRISTIAEVDLVDIEDNGKRPTGVYWLNQRYSKSR